MLLLVMSGALLGADIDFTDIVRGDDRALTRTAGPENAGDTGIIPVTAADEQRLTRTCNLHRKRRAPGARARRNLLALENCQLRRPGSWVADAEVAARAC
jgi:hypothetical protein